MKYPGKRMDVCRNTELLTMTEDRYTCQDYRQEMILLSLKKRLAAPDISEEEKERLQREVRAVEESMKMA